MEESMLNAFAKEQEEMLNDCDCGRNDPVATTPQEMLEFLANRFEHGGVSDLVAELYARDIRLILKEYYGVNNEPKV